LTQVKTAGEKRKQNSKLQRSSQLKTSKLTGMEIGAWSLEFDASQCRLQPQLPKIQMSACIAAGFD
jgi:hypothetical protein